jgi:hypothetical protein
LQPVSHGLKGPSHQIRFALTWPRLRDARLELNLFYLSTSFSGHLKFLGTHSYQLFVIKVTPIVTGVTSDVVGQLVKKQFISECIRLYT